MEPLFIVVDGLDGSGKTTIIEALTVLFEERGLPIVKTKSVGAGEIGMAVRKRVLNSDVPPDNTLTTLGMLLSNYEMYSDIALPALNTGKSVITDRFLPSYIAYQNVAMACTNAMELMDLVFGYKKFRVPDIYIYCDVDIDISIKRAKGRGVLDNFDAKDLDFKEKLKKSYDHTFMNNSAKTSISLNCNQSLTEVLLDAVEIMNKEIDLRKGL